MAVLYLTEQGSKLRKTSQRLVVEKGGSTLLEVPACGIDRILVFGAVQLSTQVISFLLDSGIDVSFLSMNARLKGKLIPVESKNVFLRLAQYDRYKDEKFKLMIARSILEAKMMNQRSLFPVLFQDAVYGFCIREKDKTSAIRPDKCTFKPGLCASRQ